MTLSLYMLRYMLVIAPGIATIFISENIPSISLYIMVFFICLVYLQRRDFQWEKRLRRGLFSLPLVGELALITVFSYQYGGMLPLAILSTLITLNNYRNSFLLIGITCYALLNILAIPTFEVLALIVTNIAFITIAVLLYRLRVTTDEKHDIDAQHETLRVKQYQHEETRQNVINYAQKIQGLTQLEERNRIAHDLHDDLGHRLIRLKMMLEAATRLGADQQDQAMDLVKEVRDQLSESMESLRSTVRRIKPASAASNQYTLEGLLDQIARDSGILVRYRTTGQPYPLYPSEEVLLYRNAQEAITNAVRHGQATEVSITLDYSADEIRMTISNNGSEPSEGSIRKGIGMLGMEERLHVIGGQLHIHYNPSFEIQTIIPRRGTESIHEGDRN